MTGDTWPPTSSHWRIVINKVGSQLFSPSHQNVPVVVVDVLSQPERDLAGVQAVAVPGLEGKELQAAQIHRSSEETSQEPHSHG